MNNFFNVSMFHAVFGTYTKMYCLSKNSHLPVCSVIHLATLPRSELLERRAVCNLRTTCVFKLHLTTLRSSKHFLKFGGKGGRKIDFFLVAQNGCVVLVSRSLMNIYGL